MVDKPVTPLRRVHVKKLDSCVTIKKCHAFHGTRRFVHALTRAIGSSSG
jgi:cysteine synthase